MGRKGERGRGSCDCDCDCDCDCELGAERKEGMSSRLAVGTGPAHLSLRPSANTAANVMELGPGWGPARTSLLAKRAQWRRAACRRLTPGERMRLALHVGGSSGDGTSMLLFPRRGLDVNRGSEEGLGKTEEDHGGTSSLALWRLGTVQVCG